MSITEGFSESFRLDPSKAVDPIERLVETHGLDYAFDELMDKLEKNPDDAETRRQANLLINRLDDLVTRLKEKTSN